MSVIRKTKRPESPVFNSDVLRRCTLAIAAFASSCFCSHANAFQLIDPPSISKDSGTLVKQLLSSDWKRATANQTNSKETYTSMQPASTAVSLAYIINRIQHNQTREAMQVASDLTVKDPDNLDGWLLKSWLSALIDQYDRALVDLGAAKKRVSDNKELSPAKKIAAYRKMGKLIGFLQGPVKTQVNPDVLESTILTISDGLAGDELEAFNKSRNLVLTRYDDLVKDQGSKAKTELEKQKAEDEHLTESLTKQNASHEQTIAQMGSEKERLRSEGNQRVSQLAGQLSPLEGQLASISTSINGIQYDLQLLYNDLAIARNNSQNNYQNNTVYYLNDQVRRREFDLYNLQADGNAVSSQLQSLQYQISQTQRSYNNQINQIDRQYKKINNTIKRNRIRMGKVAGGPELAKGKKGAMSSRLTALTSYNDLGIELYRQQLLDQVK